MINFVLGSMRVLSMFLPAALANTHGSQPPPAADSEFTILHCNNPTSMKAEMKVEVSSMFLMRNGGLDAMKSGKWGEGFAVETVGDSTIYTKIIEANDLILTEKNDDPDSKFFGSQFGSNEVKI